MFNYTTEYAQLIGSYHETYIREKRPMPASLGGIRPEIFDSWKRSIAYGVDPDKRDCSTLTPGELNQLLEDNRLLISITHSHLERLYFYVKGTNFAMALVNHEGYVIDLMADDTLIQQKADESGLALGCMRSEKTSGTSGISVCLALGIPYAVYGNEHYLRSNKDYICCAAPIYGQDHQLLGCLGLIGPYAQAPLHSLGMITAAAGVIEKELSLKQAFEKLSLINNNLVLTLNSLSCGVLLIDRKGYIIQYNENVREMLHASYSLQDIRIHELFSDPELADDIIHTTASIYNREIFVDTPDGETLGFLLNVSCNSPNCESLIIKLDRIQAIHNIVNKISGFSAKYTFDSIIGESEEMQHIKRFGQLAARNDSNVLILGESGTGKDILAQAIHNASRRSSGPFIAINCAALPNNLIESELFGYESGAFTGANKNGNPGKFELADGGTIFLDEIGDMPLELQTTLLRVLQNKEIIRIGGKHPKAVNVRIIAATNSNLEEAVRNKAFRSDLYYRLNVLSIVIPPLRERREDISLLIDHFTRTRTSGELNLNFFPPTARKILKEYSWPGNVRELENIVERVIISSGDTAVSISHILRQFLPDYRKQEITEPSVLHNSPPSGQNPEQTEFINTSDSGTDTDSGHPLPPAQERIRIMETLRQEHGYVPEAARKLQISKRTLYRKIQKYNIDLEEFRKW